jgi:hypothetical protein
MKRSGAAGTAGWKFDWIWYANMIFINIVENQKKKMKVFCLDGQHMNMMLPLIPLVGNGNINKPTHEGGVIHPSDLAYKAFVVCRVFEWTGEAIGFCLQDTICQCLQIL